jgi:hypothetical protein
MRIISRGLIGDAAGPRKFRVNKLDAGFSMKKAGESCTISFFELGLLKH